MKQRPISPVRKRRRKCLLPLIVAVCLSCAVRAQTKPPAAAAPAPVAATAADRQKAAHADADRLLALAQDLKTSVDKSRKDELNTRVIREAEEIEKLARSLRSRVQ